MNLLNLPKKFICLTRFQKALYFVPLIVTILIGIYILFPYGSEFFGINEKGICGIEWVANFPIEKT